MRRFLWMATLTVLCFTVVAAMTRFDFGAAWSAARKVGIGGVGLICGLYLLVTLLRALRIWILIKREIAFPEVLSVSFRHYLFATFLPFRIGELSLLVLLRDKGIAVGTSLPVLILARFGDVVALMLILASAAPLAGMDGDGRMSEAGQYALIVPFLVIGAVAATLVLHRRILVSLRLCLRRRRASTAALTAAGFLGELSRSLATLRWRGLWAMATLSMAVWIVSIAYVWVAVSAADLRLTIPQTAASTCLTVLIGLQPIQGWANLGTYQLSTVVIWGWYGVGAPDAFGLSMLLHLLVLGWVLFLGVGSWWTTRAA